MLGVIINTVAVIAGALVGLIFKKGIPQKVSSAVMVGIGLCVVYIGIDGMLCETNPLTAVVSIVVGTVIGTLLDIDSKLERLAGFVSRKVGQKDNSSSFTEGFVSASLLFCVGAMAIMGSIQSGLSGDHTTLITKSILDLISSIMFASTLGVGVAFSAIPVFIYQGAITLCAVFLEPVLTGGAVNSITCVGSIIIMGLGLNLTGVSKFKIANFIPAVFISPFIYYLLEMMPKG